MRGFVERSRRNSDAQGKGPVAGDGGCVVAGVQTLRGAIGAVAPTVPAGTIADVILAHTNGDDPLTGACS